MEGAKALEASGLLCSVPQKIHRKGLLSLQRLWCSSVTLVKDLKSVSVSLLLSGGKNSYYPRIGVWDSME